jgi:hypothetical protein
MDIKQANAELEELKDVSKYQAMIKTAAIITKLLEPHNIKPIVVGGLSVEIYSQSEYATRDIDFVSDGYHKIEDILYDLNFEKMGRIFFRSDIKIAVEVPDNHLAGSYEKIVKFQLDDYYYIYLISPEDIILDRLRAAIHWDSEEDRLWSFRLLSLNYDIVDIEYLKENTEDDKELALLNDWLTQLNNAQD